MILEKEGNVKTSKSAWSSIRKRKRKWKERLRKRERRRRSIPYWEEGLGKRKGIVGRREKEGKRREKEEKRKGCLVFVVERDRKSVV